MVSSMEHNKQSRRQQEGCYEGYQASALYSEPGVEPLSLSDGQNEISQPSYLAPQHEWQLAQKLQPELRESITPQQRMILAIISVVMIALFSMIVLTSTQGSSTGLIGVVIMCCAISLVNATFNRRG
jgi:hypothetical protein